MLKKISAIILSLLVIMTSTVFAEANVTNLEAPKGVSVEVKKNDGGQPYFELKVESPSSIEDLAQQSDGEQSALFYHVEYRVGTGEWQQTGDMLFSEGPIMQMNPEDMGLGENIDIKANKYDFKVRYGYLTFEVADDDGNRINTDSVDSPFSKIVSIGIDDYKVEYKEASQWAIAELDKAAELGFITDKIKNKMNGPITREEFCEIVVKLYEKLTQKQAIFDNMNAFTDTKNPEIFKANKLGIVEGVGNNKFAPNNLTNREQVATMMHRAVKVIDPNADFSTAGVGKFVDEELISNWALESVRFMNKNNIMKGDGGKIEPKGTTTREQAVLLILRTFEKFSQDATGLNDTTQITDSQKKNI